MKNKKIPQMCAVIHPKVTPPKPLSLAHIFTLTHTHKEREADKWNKDKNIYNVKIPKVKLKVPKAWVSTIDSKDFPTVCIYIKIFSLLLLLLLFFSPVYCVLPPFLANQKQTNLFWTWHLKSCCHSFDTCACVCVCMCV